MSAFRLLQKKNPSPDVSDVQKFGRVTVTKQRKVDEAQGLHHASQLPSSPDFDDLERLPLRRLPALNPMNNVEAQPVSVHPDPPVNNETQPEPSVITLVDDDGDGGQNIAASVVAPLVTSPGSQPSEISPPFPVISPQASQNIQNFVNRSAVEPRAPKIWVKSVDALRRGNHVEPPATQVPGCDIDIVPILREELVSSSDVQALYPTDYRYEFVPKKVRVGPVQ
jgi:hypothetical protein